MRRRDDLISPTLRSVLATLWLIVSPLVSAVSIDDWLTKTHDGALHVVDLEECALENGQVIEACRLTFRTYGRLARDLSNIVLMPTWLNGNAEDLAIYNYLGPDGIVDTDDYFVIAVNALGNGVSSSPSNSAQSPFPAFTIRDQVSLQHQLLTEHLEIEHLHAVVGASAAGRASRARATRGAAGGGGRGRGRLANNDGATPLFIAAQYGHDAVVQMLLQRGATVDRAANNGATPLFMAVWNGHASVVPLLLDAGAAAEQQCGKWGTPLGTAVSKGHDAIARLLRAAGAKT